jgi:predicted nucleotidyltransferase
VGGAAEGRLTILSDIDVVIALPYEPSREETIDLIEKVFEEAEEQGLPLHAPVELHVVGPRGLQRLLKRSKAVKICVNVVEPP